MNLIDFKDATRLQTKKKVAHEKEIFRVNKEDQKITFDEALELTRLLLSCFPTSPHPHSPEREKIFSLGMTSMFQRYSLEKGYAAIEKLTRENKFIPSISEVRTVLEEVYIPAPKGALALPDNGENLSEEWKEICELIKSSLGEATFQSWIVHLQPQNLTSSMPKLVAPTRFTRDWLIKNHLDSLKDIFKKYNPKFIELEITHNL